MLLRRMSGSKMRSTAFSPKAVGMVLTRSSTSFFIQRNGWPLVPVSATAPSTVIEAFEALAVTLRRCSVPLVSFTRIVSPTESGAKGLVPALHSTIVAELPVVLTFAVPFIHCSRLMRPSWGRRFSARFAPERSLMRETTAS